MVLFCREKTKKKAKKNKSGTTTTSSSTSELEKKLKAIEVERNSLRGPKLTTKIMKCIPFSKQNCYVKKIILLRSPRNDQIRA
jgi:hypothetical protein